MGVHGLWRLIEPSGKPVPLETLENKVLAVDVSIWLHQAIKGFQDSKGASVPNAHLLGIYHRVCKLLYFKVKPVFVFDGGVPALKKQTIAKRTQSRLKTVSEADRIHKQLLSTLLKHTAISNVLSEKTKAELTSPSKKSPQKKSHDEDNLYSLPPSKLGSTETSSDDDLENTSTSETTDSSPTKHWDLHSIDMSSTHFKSLPADVRHEILTDLKETRKQSSWGRIHEMPVQSDDFSVYQVNRLLKRNAVQTALEDVEKEMGGHSLSLGELESLLKDQGVIKNSKAGNRIASDENTRYLLIKNVKQAIEKARKEQEMLEAIKEENEDKEEFKEHERSLSQKIDNLIILEKKIQETPSENNLSKCDIEQREEVTEDLLANEEKLNDEEHVVKNKADQEFEEDLQRAIALSLQDEPSTSSSNDCKNIGDLPNEKGKRRLQFSFLENDEDFESDSSEDFEEVPEKNPSKTLLSSAQNYMKEYSGLTPNEIAKIINSNSSKVVARNPSKSEGKIRNTISKESISIKKTEEVNEIRDTNVADMAELSKQIPKTIKINNGLENEESMSKSEETKLAKVDEVKMMSDSDDSHHVEANDENLEHMKQDNKIKTSTSTEEAKVDQVDMSDSDDSDLVEVVEDNLIKPVGKIEDGSNINSKAVNTRFEIVVKPDEEVEDDLFSDIFSHADSSVKPITKDDLNISEEIIKEVVPNKEESNIIVEDIRKSREQSSSLTELIVNNKHDAQIEEISTTTINPNIVETTEDIANQMQQSLRNAPAVHTNMNGEKRVEKIQKIVEKPRLTKEEMNEMKDNLRKEQIDLVVEKSTKERMANNITDQMYQEAQELLELFGVPYIVAPMEAEAQCAFLDEMNLTDGTITDDSDIWLFGGRTVYKNFFNQAKHVMEFRAENIQHHFKLSREQMILLALLVGSDYTTGIQGVGPVTALEILAAFPPKNNEFQLSQSQLISGLAEFRRWFTKGKSAKGPARLTLRNKLKNALFTENFPNMQVVQAYLEPEVEKSEERFSWAKPDAVGLMGFAREKFGWHMKKTEEILNPVLKRIDENRMQKSIKDYFKTKHKIDSGEVEGKMSKRVRTALDRIGKDPTEVEEEEKKPQISRKKKNDNEEQVKKPLRNRKKNDGDTAKKPRRIFKKKESEALVAEEIPKELTVDEDVEILKQVQAESSKRVEDIHNAAKEEIDKQAKKKVVPNLHQKEYIPQKLRDKSDILRNKLKAIEVFRKSKQGPGYVRKRVKKAATPKEDAGLSESSDE